MSSLDLKHFLFPLLHELLLLLLLPGLLELSNPSLLIPVVLLKLDLFSNRRLLFFIFLFQLFLELHEFLLYLVFPIFADLFNGS